MCDSQLVPQRRSPDAVPRANKREPKRVEYRNDDGHDESSLIGPARNLNRHKA